MIEQDEDIITVDPGHMYLLSALDVPEGEDPNIHDVLIRYVKRVGRKYPGNVNKAFPKAYPGITVQKNLRAILYRIEYVDKQKPCIENKLFHFFVRVGLWLLEFRAARHNKIFYFKSLNYAYKSKMCKICGHTVCRHTKGV